MITVKATVLHSRGIIAHSQNAQQNVDDVIHLIGYELNKPENINKLVEAFEQGIDKISIVIQRQRDWYFEIGGKTE